jgi:hypothetical protein
MFRVEEAMAKVALHQAAMGNTGQSHNTSMNLKRQDHDEKLRSVVSNFSNMSVQSNMVNLFLL